MSSALRPGMILATAVVLMVLTLVPRLAHADDQPRDAAQSLLDAALDRGGKDNVTVIVARYEVPSLVSPGTRETAEEEQVPAEPTDSVDATPPLTLASLF